MKLLRLAAIVLATLLILNFPFAADLLTNNPKVDAAFKLLRQSGQWQTTTYADCLDIWKNQNPGKGAYHVLPETGGLPYVDQEAPDGVSRLTYAGDVVQYNIRVDHAGLYQISINYKTIDQSLTANIISLLIDEKLPYDEAENLELATYWADESKNFVLDKFGHETTPRSVPIHKWRCIPLRASMYYNAEPLLFYLDSGLHLIEIENLSNPLALGMLIVEGAKEIPTYQEYSEEANKLPQFMNVLTVSATEYIEKNSSYINLMCEPNPDLEPYSAGVHRLNIIDGEGYKIPGQEVTFAVEAPETGRYRLSLIYSSRKEDAPVYRSIMINGVIPFKEAGLIALPPTYNRFTTWTVADDNGMQYEWVLKKGINTITFHAVPGPAGKAAQNLSLCLDHINLFTQQIRRITGKDIDVNRTWRLTAYLPETTEYLHAYLLILKSTRDMLASQWPYGSQSAALSDLNIAINRLEKLSENPDILPVKLDAFSSGTGSVAELIGTQIEKLLDQPLTLNAFYLHGDMQPLSTKKSIFVHIAEWFRSLLASFNQNETRELSKSELSVWVNRPVQQVDLIQRMTDSLFYQDTGIQTNIYFSHLADEGRLILAKASGTSPDVVIGLSGWIPYELSIRGAGYDLTQFSDFWSFATDFPPGAFVPLMFDGGVYAIPESLDFQLLFYRKDIIESIGLDIPQTWDDVIDMLPELQRYGLGFYHQMAVNSAYKWFNITYIDLAQFGCSLYSEDGSRVNLSSPEGIAALDFQTKLFTTYSMPEQVASFYQSFRRGTIPIGIGNFYTYVQLKSAAPEIAGQWAVALMPGQVDRNGTIQRWTPGLATTAFMFDDVADPQTAWAFMKWWLSDKTQSDFGYRLQSIFGPTYMWLPANLKAVDVMPVEKQDREVIRKQLEWIAEPPKTPATYMVERGLSDIWNMVVFDGVPVRIAIDKKEIEMNRELRRKLEEFGYIQNGQLVKPYKLPSVTEIKAEMQKYAQKEQEK